MMKKKFFWPGLVFLATNLVYILTLSPSVNFWDSGDFIRSGHQLIPSHAPGSPVYLLLTRLISLPFSGGGIGLVFNLFSALTCALSSALVYMIVYHILKDHEKEAVKVGAGAVGGLSLGFVGSVWSVATTAEVYGLSLAFALINLYIVLVARDARKILLNVFIWSLSVGVHQMNFGMIIPIVLMAYLHSKKTSFRRIMEGLVIASMAFVIARYGLFLGLVRMGKALDIWMVNTYHAAFNTGPLLLLVVLFVVLLGAVVLSRYYNQLLLERLSLSVVFTLIGFSSYLILLVGNDNSGQVTTWNRLDHYVSSAHLKQFAERPLLHGPSYNSPVDSNVPLVFGEKRYAEFDDQYLLTDDGFNAKVNYEGEFDSYFPRMIYRSPTDKALYPKWVNLEGPEIAYEVNGRQTRVRKVGLADNLEFFLKFQLGWANLRYLLKNFVGSQNSHLSNGNTLNGNWQFGLKSLDSWRLGDSDFREMNQDQSSNYYYGLPLLFALLGLSLLISKHRNHALPILLVILLYTVGLSIYLNTGPQSLLVRERDYIFLIPYAVLALGVGLSVAVFYSLVSRSKDIRRQTLLSILIVGTCVPVQFLTRNMDDQDRSTDTLAYDLAMHYLEACDESAVLITNGDNATYPLWYLQEVEGFRRDVKVINYDLLFHDWYWRTVIDSTSFSPALVTWINSDIHLYGTQKEIPFVVTEDSRFPWELTYLTEHITANRNQQLINEKRTMTFPSQKFLLHAEPSAAREYSDSTQSELTRQIIWEYAQTNYRIADLLLFDLIGHNYPQRPVYFTNTGSYRHMMGLDPFTVEVGLVKKLLPLRSLTGAKIVDEEVMTDLLTNTRSFDFSNGGFLSQDHKNIAEFVLRPCYYYLADHLIVRGQLNEAEEVLKQCLEKIPNESVRFKENMFDLARLFYLVNNPQRGREIMKTIFDNFSEEVNLLKSVSADHLINKEAAGQKMSLLGFMVRRYKDVDRQYVEILDHQVQALEEEYADWMESKTP